MRDDVDGLADARGAMEVCLASITEGDDAVYEGEDCVIFACVYVLARDDLRAALAYDDFADANLVAVSTLHTQVFWV